MFFSNFGLPGPLGSALERLLSRLRALLDRLETILGRLGLSWIALGAVLELHWTSLGLSWTSLGRLGCLLGRLGRLLEDLRPSWKMSQNASERLPSVRKRQPAVLQGRLGPRLGPYF